VTLLWALKAPHPPLRAGKSVLALYHNSTNNPVGRPGGPSGAVDGPLASGIATRSSLKGSMAGHSIAYLKGTAMRIYCFWLVPVP